MAFKQNLQKELKLPFALAEKLPAGYQLLGSICILNLRPELKKAEKKIALAVLKTVPQAKTVLVKTSGVKGEMRTPQLKFLAGKRNFTAWHKENNCVFEFDVRKSMWAQGNMSERQREISEAKKGEKVLDLFAGMGDWSIPLAKKGSVVTAVEAEKETFEALEKNCRSNKTKINCIFGNAENVSLPEKFDKILMGWLPAPFFAFENALKHAKRGARIYFHCTARKGEAETHFEQLKEIAHACKRKIALEKVVEVKSYAPFVFHYVLEVKAE
ncbi:MAG: methyltransferase domain-containing protein [Candidatus Diapherotrites archaeon]